MKNLVGKKLFFEWCIDIQTLNDKSNTTIIHAFNLKKKLLMDVYCAPRWETLFYRESLAFPISMSNNLALKKVPWIIGR